MIRGGPPLSRRFPFRPAILACLLGALTSGALTSACGGGGASPAGDPGLSFFLQSSTPIDGAIRVPLDQTIFITFNKALQVSSVERDSLSLRTAAGAVIAGSASLVQDGEDRTLRYTTIQNLASGEMHDCTVAAALRSRDDEPLEGPASISFTAEVSGGGLGLPSAGQLRPASGQLNEGRQGHAATLLQDGRVLVTGGFSLGGAATDTAEFFHAATEVFVTLSARMRASRAGHTATLMTDGRVLLAGGWFETSPGQTAVRATAEVFDPSLGSFVTVGDLNQARADHAAVTMPDGRVLLTGGSDWSGGFIDLDDAEIFDPLTNTFSTAPELMTTFRSTHGMLDRGDGTFLLAGGSLGDLRAERYNLFTGEFIALNSAAGDGVRFGPAMAFFESGAAAVAGGEATGTVLHISTTNFVQNTGSGLTRPRSYATATRIKPDQILVAGGIDISNGRFIESSCDVLIEGGIGGSNTFATEVRFGTGMAHHTATILPTGDILFCGGLNEDGALPNKKAAFIFDVE